MCMPLWWLAGNCENLSQRNFGVADMESVVDRMYKKFYDVLIDREKLINEDFIMGIFDGIMNKLRPLREYLDLMSEKKQGRFVGSCKEEDKIFPWDLLWYEFFYPTDKDIVDTNSFCIELTCEQASIFRVEFKDKRKVTNQYLSSIGGEKGMKKVEKE